MSPLIVDSIAPVALIGGAQIGPTELNILQMLAPIWVAADGGADHALPLGRDLAAVIGDLDSLSQAARTAYASVLHECVDPDTTDFQKVLARVAAPCLLAAGFLGGRLDHTLAVLNALAGNPGRPIVLISGDDAAFLAPTPVVSLRLQRGARVGLMPLGRVTASTAGLCWDFSDRVMTPDGFISSSNAAAGDRVTIRAEGPLLITLPLSELSTAIGAVRAGQ